LIKYSFVIPAYAEQEFIGDALDRLQQYLKSIKIFDCSEVIVVAADGGDDTASIVREKIKSWSNIKLLEPGPKVGKGRDVRLGILNSVGSSVLFMDADLATPLKYIEPTLDLLAQKNSAVVVGVRDLLHAHKGIRKYGSYLSNILIRTVIRSNIADTQCGFKAFSSEAASKIFGSSLIDGWGFDIEVLYLAKKYNYSIKTIAIVDWFDPKDDQGGLAGESKIKAFIRTLGDLRRIIINDLRKKYEKI
jgi:dolichyl-phosphate beta-glucosyltransferase